MKRKTYVTAGIVTLVTVGVLSAGFVWSGIYNVAADDAHTRPVYALMETLRERSIASRASGLQSPFDLSDPQRIRQGAGNYNAMCVGCHLGPGMDQTELSRGLYPAPPDLSKATVDAAEAFWVIKHGIKASGMPAWGKSMGDEYIWNMAAFVQALPMLDNAQYQALVASSGGHDHGGGETRPHAHAEDTPADHHAASEEAHADQPSGTADEQSSDHPHPPQVVDHDETAASTRESTPETITHRHADGTVESHPAPTGEADTPKADDGHDHQH